MKRSPSSPARSRADLLVLAAAAVYVAAGLMLGFRPFDDTFITFRYARNIAAGHGFVYNQFEHVLGTTSPLWALMLAAVDAVRVPIATGALVLSLLADAVTAWLITRLSLRLGTSRAAATAAALVFLGTFDYLTLARSGMETSLFTMLVFAALAAAAADRAVAAGLTAGLAAITRPEGLIVLPVVALALLAATSREHRVMRFRPAVVATVACAVVVGAWTAFAVGYFGSAVPQSVAAKSAAASGPALAHLSWVHVRMFLTTGQYGGNVFEPTWWSLQWLRTLLASAGIVVAARAGVRVFLLVAALPIVIFSGLAATHAFTWFPWYYGFFYPCFALLAVFAVDRLVPQARRGAVIAALSAAWILAQTASAWLVKLPADQEFWVEGYRRVSADIPADSTTVIAASEIGTIGWYAWPATIIDLAGLVTPEAVTHPAAAVLARRRPEFIVLRTDNGQPLLEDLARTSWFAAEYELRRTVPDPSTAREFRTYRRR